MQFDGFHLFPQEILDESCSLPVPELAENSQVTVTASLLWSDEVDCFHRPLSPKPITQKRNGLKLLALLSPVLWV